jgi:hypothetical protein
MLDARTIENMKTVKEYIHHHYKPDKLGRGISRPSIQGLKASLAYLHIVSPFQARLMAETLFGEKWIGDGTRYSNWVQQGRKLLVAHAHDALPISKSYSFVRQLKAERLTGMQ